MKPLNQFWSSFHEKPLTVHHLPETVQTSSLKKQKKTEKTRFHTTIFVACTQTMFHFSVRSSFFSKTLASTRAKQDAPTPIPLCWRSINPLGFLLLDVFWRKNRGYVIRLPYLQDNNYFGSAWTSQVKKVNCNVNEISINCESCNN